MRAIIFFVCVSAAVGCSSTPKATSVQSDAAEKNWKDRSDDLAKEYSLSDAERYPEGVAALGYREYDSKAVQLEDDMETRDIAHLQEWKAKLEKLLAQESDEELRTDYQVLIDKIAQKLDGIALKQKYHEVEYCLGTKTVFNSLQSLINPQSSAERKKAAVDRFKAYVNGHGRFQPLLEACVSRSRFTIKRAGNASPLYPLQSEIQEYLEQSPQFLGGIEELLGSSGSQDWKADFENFKGQVAKHDKFIKDEILSNARTDYRLPKDYYAHILKVRGIKASPDELIKMARTDYKSLYKKFEALAARIAKDRGLKDKRPSAVIQSLKKAQVTKASEVEQLYKEADQTLKKIIDSNKLVSLPTAPLKIRLAGDAESKAKPIPHLTMPPLVNNQGERPEFVVPTSSAGGLPFDDFSYQAAGLVLTAHEGRPGHDLQFSSMLDNGVSVIRALYAANNVNIEGWGLYAEELVFPYLPAESQLVALQTRLWRVARGFLDPQIQLGQIKPEGVIKVFSDIGVSEIMGALEVRRYTYEDPGQAPSYYYGLTKILEAKQKTKNRLGDAFSEKCFNDAVLELGLLPVDFISRRLAVLKCDRM